MRLIFLSVVGVNLFGDTDASPFNATLVLLDLDPSKNSAMSSLRDLGNQAGDIMGDLGTRITKAGMTLASSGYTSIGFDAFLSVAARAVGIWVNC